MADAPRLSARAPWEAAANRLALVRRRIEARGEPILDLTVSNPTAVGLDLPLAELADALGRAGRSSYEPHPLGLPSAKEALAEWMSTPDEAVHPSDLVLTASTSEAYAILFKLLCNPAERILTHKPTYPLLDHLAALEGIGLGHFPLDYVPGSAHRWRVDPDRLRAALTEETRAIVAIHPNNPTGHFLRLEEQDLLARCCAPDRALISDEVFGDYELEPRADSAGPAAARGDVLSFSLGGLSKSAGLPHWKLGWIRVGGPPGQRKRALAALELVCDTYLSVATPVQKALPDVLSLAPLIRDRIRNRLRRNLGSLRAAVADHPGLEILPVEGGWSAVIRIPRLTDDETLAVGLLERSGVAVHPGYFFDFEAEGFIVVSLLPDPGVFDEATRRLVTNVTARCTPSGG